MAEIVLVHGAFSGGFVWRPIADELRAAGHHVWTPTLTGLGERRHLLSPAVDLETHVRDLEAVLYFEDIHDAVVVAHSYAGMVVAGLGTEAAARVSEVILLDAALPNDGESIHDLLAGDQAALPPVLRNLHEQDQADDSALVIPLDPSLGDDPRLSPQPISTHWAKVRMGPVFETARERIYISCTKRPDGTRASMSRALAAGWTVWELEAPHNAPVTHPQKVASLIERALGDAEAARARDEPPDSDRIKAVNRGER